MREIIIGLFAFAITWIAIVVLAVVVLHWRLQRRNRVSPAVKSPAPLVWLWSPMHPARLHRRLRSVVDDLHVAAPVGRAKRDSAPTLSVDSSRRQLEGQAIELDHHLVIAARHPRRHRRELLRRLDGQVTEVELLSLRISRLSRPVGAPASGWDVEADPPALLARVADQLDLLEQAQRELTEVERAAGLIDPNKDFVAGPTLPASQPGQPGQPPEALAPTSTN